MGQYGCIGRLKVVVVELVWKVSGMYLGTVLGDVPGDLDIYLQKRQIHFLKAVSIRPLRVHVPKLGLGLGLG